MSVRIGGLRGRYRAGVAVLTLFTALSLALPAAAAACGEGDEDTGPVIKFAHLTPVSFSYEGGTAVVTTEVEDDCGIQQVYAEVSNTEGAYWGFQLLPFENINSNSIVYRGEFQVVPNYQESAVNYQVTISAEDTNGALEQAYAESEVAGRPPFDEAPYVSEAKLSTTIAGSTGTPVRIAANASDTRGLANVFAIVTLPDETQQEVPMEGVSSSHFEGRYKPPPNLGATPQKYSVIVYAEDDIGQRSWESAGSFVVARRTGLLNSWMFVGGYFGEVPVGQTSTRLLVVGNQGGPLTQPVEASITISGADFELQGAAAGKLDVTLNPGDHRTFTIKFAPISRGLKVGSVVVSRKDGAQPDMSQKLTGQAIKPASP